MELTGPYDQTLHIFVQEPRDPDPGYLLFLRWLAEQGLLEHEVAGPPGGSYALTRSAPDGWCA